LPTFSAGAAIFSVHIDQGHHSGFAADGCSNTSPQGTIVPIASGTRDNWTTAKPRKFVGHFHQWPETCRASPTTSALGIARGSGKITRSRKRPECGIQNVHTALQSGKRSRTGKEWNIQQKADGAESIPRRRNSRQVQS
jgi:hypothetical protein